MRFVVARLVALLLASVMPAACADPPSSQVPTTSSSSGSTSSASPSLATDLAPLFTPEYVEATTAFLEARDRFFELSPSGDRVDAAYLDHGERVLKEVERTFAEWWVVAEPVAQDVGGVLGPDMRRYAEKFQRWDQIQRRFLAGLRNCLPISGSGEETARCLDAQGLGRSALEENDALTAWLRDHTVTIALFDMGS